VLIVELFDSSQAIAGHPEVRASSPLLPRSPQQTAGLMLTRWWRRKYPILELETCGLERTPAPA
jgi:hypothetical protein